MSGKSLLNWAVEPRPGQLGFCTATPTECTAPPAGLPAFPGVRSNAVCPSNAVGLPFCTTKPGRFLAKCEFEQRRRGSKARSIRALAASGANLANVSRRRPKHLDREVMILWLQQRQGAGKSLKLTAVCLENRDYALKIRRTFGNWRDAIDAAGVR